MSFRCLGRYVAALSLAALLAACETAPDGEDLVAEAEPALEAEPDAEDAGSDPAQADPAQEDPAQGDPAQGLVIETGAPAPEVAALPPEPVIDDDPQQLYGLNPAALDELLGQPSLIRTELPAQIWQYRSQTCVFDIFLYEEAGEARVTYVEARDGTAARIEARLCLNELLRARMGLPLG